MLVSHKLVGQAAVQQLLMVGLVEPQQVLLALPGLQIHSGRLPELQALVAVAAVAMLRALVALVVTAGFLVALVVAVAVERAVAALVAPVQPAL
jgi:hypothetical protein